MVKVGFFADFRALTGTKETQIPLVPTIADAVELLSQKYGRVFSERCRTLEGKIDGKKVNIFINGLHIAHLKQNATPLKEGDDVRIFPVIAGG